MPSPLWSSDEVFTLDGVTYRTQLIGGKVPPSTSDGMVIFKTRDQIEGYEALIDALRPRSVVELGIFKGGSVALIAQLARPDKLVAIDVEAECRPLDRFIDAHSLRGVVVPYCGVDQADGAALHRIMQAEFAGSPIDLVIDDASHLLAETRASFNRLFPSVRPGGVYVIEDWGWANTQWPVSSKGRGQTPLSVFGCELLLACARRPGLVAAVTADQHILSVHRGPRKLDPYDFDISENIDPVSQEMVKLMSGARSP
jgi:cephalosporin hydroxylase